MGEDDRKTLHSRRPDSGPLPEDPTILLQRYDKLIRKVAHSLHRKVPDSVDIEDLVGWGVAGLLEAYQRYDETRPARFATYAYYRIRGSMLDAISDLIGDYSLKAEVACNEVLRTFGFVSQSFDTFAGPEERMGPLGDVLGSVGLVYVLSEDPAVALRPGHAPQAVALVQEEAREAIKKALKKLPEKERTLLTEVYYNDRSLSDVAREMGFSPSWGSRMHTRALDKLKAALKGDFDFSGPPNLRV